MSGRDTKLPGQMRTATIGALLVLVASDKDLELHFTVVTAVLANWHDSPGEVLFPCSRISALQDAIV